MKGGPCGICKPVLLLIALLLSCAFAQEQTDVSPQVNVNPCTEKLAVKDEGFAIGLAYWPGGKVEDWQRAEAGLSPCSAAAGQLDGVQVAAYQLKVDTIGLMRTSRELESGLFNSASSSGRPELLSVVAFAGSVRSEARYIWSAEPDVTGGVGVLRSLSLIAQFDDGKLDFLRWQEDGCLGCAIERCLDTGLVYNNASTFACAEYETSTCSAPAPAGDGQEDDVSCMTAIQVGMSGTDENHVVLNTGTQLQRIKAYSIGGLYSSVSNTVNSAAGSITDTFTGNSGSDTPTTATPEPTTPETGAAPVDTVVEPPAVEPVVVGDPVLAPTPDDGERERDERAPRV